MKVIGNVELENVKKLRSGKVREMFAFNDKILIVTTDRISAFDFILQSLIPLKGAILNKISIFWFDYLKSVIKNHLIEVDINKFPKILKKQKNILKHRSVIVKRARVIPIECVVRGYLAGSGWNEYKESEKIGDIKLPPNLKMCEKLPEAIFTPTTKEDTGHDIGITIKKAKKIFGSKLIDYIKEKSIELYLKASEYALGKGIIIADTKFEFGMIGDEVILIDEVLTPDSSRFWPLKDYEPGRDQNSFDKQYVRNYLLSTDWDRTSTPPKLPPDIIEKTTQRYANAYEKLVGRKFDFK
ncbi:MAG: phosphoribosylaminoimidazolesuccinocarboxamide synthase [Actinobacteria bacterium]|nr:phosphoribosylaminoimidazolesuccinocarboxamide synthase [Actinomycetota bacterium]MBL7124016.1 phosphoribosylaminoimidazolesuccinocarboxamide synthase [Actinomycetota bacterium]